MQLTFAEVRPGALCHGRCLEPFFYLPLSGPAVKHSSARSPRRQERPGKKAEGHGDSGLRWPGGGRWWGGALLEDGVYGTPSASLISLRYAKTPRFLFHYLRSGAG